MVSTLIIAQSGRKWFDGGNSVSYGSPMMTLKAMFAERGLKQNWIAGRLGVTQSHFSEMVRGIKSVPVEIVLPLAAMLNVSAEDVLRAVTRKPNDPT